MSGPEKYQGIGPQRINITIKPPKVKYRYGPNAPGQDPRYLKQIRRTREDQIKLQKLVEAMERNPRVKFIHPPERPASDYQSSTGTTSIDFANVVKNAEEKFHKSEWKDKPETSVLTMFFEKGFYAPKGLLARIAAFGREIWHQLSVRCSSKKRENIAVALVNYIYGKAAVALMKDHIKAHKGDWEKIFNEFSAAWENNPIK